MLAKPALNHSVNAEVVRLSRQRQYRVRVVVMRGKCSNADGLYRTQKLFCWRKVSDRGQQAVPRSAGRRAVHCS